MQNSIRHNLSLYSFFLKEKRPSNLPGKGSYWSISPEGKENMMREVLKHKQPVIHTPGMNMQTQSKGLRPILPKPCGPSPESTLGNGVQLVGDGSVPGLPSGIPIVILPTHLYISMANKLAAQATTGSAVAIGIKPGLVPTTMELSSSGAEVGLQNTASSTDSSWDGTVEPAEVMVEDADSSINCKTPGTRSRNCDAGSENSSNGNLLPTLVLPASLKNQITSTNPDPVFSESDSGIDCSPTACQINSSNDYNCESNKRKKVGSFGEPSSKRQKQRKKKKTVKTHCPTSMQTTHEERTQLKKSPLREYSQPTLAAINSNSNMVMSPTGILNAFSANISEIELSPVKATPTKDSMGRNSLSTTSFFSPTTSTALGYNCHQAFTPLKFDSDSGFFTPFADGDFEYGFLVSPSRYSSAVTPGKLNSTPQRCRKSLRLGAVREEGQGNDSLDWLQF